MTKKDYIKLAKLIKESTIDSKSLGVFISQVTFTNGLCDILKEDNPRFDKERFIAACQ